VPYADGGQLFIGAQPSLNAWQQIQSCGPNVSTRVTANTVCDTRPGCDGGVSVTLCSITGGYHILYPALPSGRTIPDLAWELFTATP
jgi:hypothetical protein